MTSKGGETKRFWVSCKEIPNLDLGLVYTILNFQSDSLTNKGDTAFSVKLYCFFTLSGLYWPFWPCFSNGGPIFCYLWKLEDLRNILPCWTQKSVQAFLNGDISKKLFYFFDRPVKKTLSSLARRSLKIASIFQLVRKGL